ncbi:MAG: redoxin domain-containing protein [Ferruginibacter sp.]
MKQFIILLLAGCFFLKANSQTYKITLHAVNFKSGTAYLAYHMGKDLDAEDSAVINDKGIAVFTGKKRLPGGIYTIVFPGKTNSVDFLIDTEQIMSIKTDTTDLLNKTVVTGSNENTLFEEYEKYTAGIGKQLAKERASYSKAQTKADSLMYEERYRTYYKELDDYRESIMKNQPTSMMAVLLKAMKEPKILNATPITREDSVANYNYYKAHYWDGVTFMDERIIRTPFFLPKLEKYYQDVIVQNSDSIIQESDYQLLLARSCPEMYKFLLNWLTDEYINPKYMGQDAVFVHLFDEYHSKGLSGWLTDKQQQIISRRAYMLMSNLIGQKAANLQMLDTANNPTELYNVDADYVVVCFWDPTCGHCQMEVPKIDSVYHASWVKHNVKIFGVLTEQELPAWKKYIRDHNLGDWVNAYETKAMEDADYAAQRPGFKQLYDVTVTPTLYLLDKDKHIIAKKLSWEQINDFLQVKWNKTAAN